MEYSLPPPPDVFGVDGIVVGRGVGLLALLTGAMLMHRAIKALGDQLHAIGVSAPSQISLETDSRNSRVVDQGETETH
jgi:hypothetical protein